MKTNKIGILTLYHNSNNYGALLQAYALTEFINKNIKGKKAEQITYDIPYEKRDFKEIIGRKNFIKIVINKIFLKMRVSIFNFIVKRDISGKYSKRMKKNKDFRNLIPHSEEIFSNNIEQLNNVYDIFISGSDQVWNPTWFRSACFLDFVKDEKRKIAYAASMGINILTEKKAEKMIPLVNRIDYISVREKKAKDILQKYISNKSISVVVDPVLLLPVNEWEKLAVSPLSGHKYAFAYFLGEKRENIKYAKKIRKLLNIELTTIPFLHMSYRKCERNFGDNKIKDAGPKEFLGLIKDAELILTDSFHATVFSIIFKKKFYVFKRDGDNEPDSMNSRITDLLENLGLANRIVTSKNQLSKVFLEKEIDYTYANTILDKEIKFSMEFLENAILESSVS